MRLCISSRIEVGVGCKGESVWLDGRRLVGLTGRVLQANSRFQQVLIFIV